MMTTLDETLAELRRREEAHRLAAADHTQTAETERHNAEVLAARIAGIEEARALLDADCVRTLEAGRSYVNERGKQRKPRRDIRAMVAQWCQEHTAPDDLFPHYIAKQLDCRVPQVEAALKALDKRDVGETP
jgi:hypothetical protein